MLPNREHARVDPSKIINYLLSQSHPDGRTKAEFFTRFGLRAERWQQLAEALRAVGTTNPVVAVVESLHGVRYTVDGSMQAPDGRMPKVRTVWIIESEGYGPRLITAHPL